MKNIQAFLNVLRLQEIDSEWIDRKTKTIKSGYNGVPVNI